MEGIFVINKPVGPTSHDIIAQLRKKTGIKKIGHAGTLDPLASGVLVVAIGREYTKQLNNIVKTEKEYIAEIKLGEYSTTDDAEGEKQSVEKISTVDKSKIKNILPKFIGKIRQMPPVYSAVKIKGQPAHRRVRRGEKVELGERQVEIKEIEILGYEWPILKIKVVCGSGVYIRALARDIGKELAVGGYLISLQRTRVGDYKLDQAVDL